MATIRKLVPLASLNGLPLPNIHSPTNPWRSHFVEVIQVSNVAINPKASLEWKKLVVADVLRIGNEDVGNRREFLPFGQWPVQLGRECCGDHIPAAWGECQQIYG